MKSTLFLAAALALGLSACATKSTFVDAGTTPAGTREIDLTGGDTMKYNITLVEARPGEPLRLVLSNVGNVPKDVMGHNFVLLRKGTDIAAFAQKAANDKASNYLPASVMDQVIVSIKQLGPHESAAVDFNAPTEPGTYDYLCTFPGHYMIGMRGELVVK
jgi:azurin